MITKNQGKILAVHTDYNGLGRLQYLFGQQETAVLDTEYTADVVMKVIVPKEQYESLPQKITEQTNGTAQMEWEKETVYAVIDKKVVLFPS